MEIRKYIEQYQPVSYRIFLHALQRQKLAHAYMLVGDKGVPLLSCAKYFAKSILCESPNPMACDTCLNCLRINDDNYVDLKIINGEEASIKKSMMDEIQNVFQHTPVESKGISIYIIHLVENMTIEAINSILKFLEEPNPNTYAFLTCENEMKVLPTILSRTQILRFHLIDRDIVINDAVSNGVNKEDAELLSAFYNDADLIKEQFSNESYVELKNCLLELLKKLDDNPSSCLFYSINTISPLLKKKEVARIFFDMLTIAFKDIANKKANLDITLKSYDTIITSLASKLTNIDEKMVLIMNARNDLNKNLSIPLLLDKVIIKITED